MNVENSVTDIALLIVQNTEVFWTITQYHLTCGV